MTSDQELETMELYGALISPYVRKTATVMDIKGLNYELIMVIPGSPPEGYAAISPLMKIPALVDGNTKIADSTVICEYLEDQYPTIATKPSLPADRAKSRWLEEYADTNVSEAAAGIFFERLVKPALMNQPADEARVTHLIDELLPPVQDYLETQLPEKDFLFGSLGSADISIATMFINAQYGGYQIDQQRWPKLQAFIERVKTHPVVANILSKEQEILAMLTTNN